MAFSSIFRVTLGSFKAMVCILFFLFCSFLLFGLFTFLFVICFLFVFLFVCYFFFGLFFFSFFFLFFVLVWFGFFGVFSGSVALFSRSHLF